MMLAISQLKHGAEFVVYLIAFVLFVVAAIIAWVPWASRPWATFVAAGLALFAFVLWWNALALS